VFFPEAFNGKDKTIHVKFIPRDSNEYMQEYAVELKLKRKHAVSGYTGFAWYWGRIADKSYTVFNTVNADSTISSNIKSEQTSKVEMGISGTIQMGLPLNNAETFHAHFLLGAGLSMSAKPRPSLITGIGGAIGKTHALTINIGLITGYREVLKSSLNTSEIYGNLPETITTTKLKSNFMLSIGYAFKL
jgi:hypothetical protein